MRYKFYMYTQGVAAPRVKLHMHRSIDRQSAKLFHDSGHFYGSGVCSVASAAVEAAVRDRCGSGIT